MPLTEETTIRNIECPDAGVRFPVKVPKDPPPAPPVKVPFGKPAT